MMVCTWMALGGILVVLSACAWFVLVYCLAEKCPVCGCRGNANPLRDDHGRLNDFRCMKCGHEWAPEWVVDERRHEETKRRGS